MKFEETGNLGVLPGKGQKLVVNETIKEVTTAVAERAFTSSYSSASAQTVSCELEILWSMV